jgi:YHS domain-containing protein
MKKVLIISILFIACHNNYDKDKKTPKIPASQQMTMPQNKYAGIHFASSKDLACGMPLKAGIDDTAHYKGKIYGFCSTECKDEFLKNPESHLSKK